MQFSDGGRRAQLGEVFEGGEIGGLSSDEALEREALVSCVSFLRGQPGVDSMNQRGAATRCRNLGQRLADNIDPARGQSPAQARNQTEVSLGRLRRQASSQCSASLLLAVRIARFARPSQTRSSSQCQARNCSSWARAASSG